MVGSILTVFTFIIMRNIASKHMFVLWYISIHLALVYGRKPFHRIHEFKKKITNVSVFLCICAQFQNLFENSLENINLKVNMNFSCGTVQAIVFLYCILYYCFLSALLCPFLFWFLLWENVFWNLWPKILYFYFEKGCVLPRVDWACYFAPLNKKCYVSAMSGRCVKWWGCKVIKQLFLCLRTWWLGQSILGSGS